MTMSADDGKPAVNRRGGVPRERPGRPTGLTCTVNDDGMVEWTGPAHELLVAIRACSHKRIAARYAGVSRQTFDNWLDRGRVARQRAHETGRAVPKRDQVYVWFVDAVEEAEAFAEVRLVTTIVAEVSRRPEVGVRLLQQRWPERWKPAEQIELGPTTGQREVDEQREDPTEILRRKLNDVATRRQRATDAAAAAASDVIDVEPVDER